MQWSVLGENAGLLLGGLLVTIEVAIAGFVLAMAIGLLVAVLRAAPSAALRRIGTAYVETIRNIPLLVQIFFFFFGLPSLGIRLSGFACGVIGLGIYTAAFVAEALRAGILAVPKGQLEAAQASGMSYFLAMRLVVLPQAVAAAIPPLGNTTINMIKNTALVGTIAVDDILHVADTIGSRTFAYPTAYLGSALLYLLLTIPTAAAVNALEKRLAVPGR